MHCIAQEENQGNFRKNEEERLRRKTGKNGGHRKKLRKGTSKR